MIGSGPATTVEVEVTCENVTHRTTPIVTEAAHTVERAIAEIAVTWNGKLQG